MDYNERALKVIANQINDITKSSIERASFDKTHTYTVIKDLGNNHYTVFNNGDTIDIKTSPNLSLKVTDKIHILFPENNRNNKIILEDLVQSYINNNTNESNGFGNIQVDNNMITADNVCDVLKLISGENITISSNEEDKSITISSKDWGNDIDDHKNDTTVHVNSTEKDNWNEANNKKHDHSNKSIIDKIAQTLLDNWDTAYTHISDTVKHITSAERTNWNAAKTHADSAHARTDATKVAKSTTNGNILINGTETNVYTHPSGTNPHGTTKSDVDLGNVPNVSTNDQTPSYNEATTLTKMTSGEKLSVAFGKISKAITDFISHIGNKSNPHEVTKEDVGLENVENKSSITIRSELTKENVVTALGYTPSATNTTYGIATSSTPGLIKSGEDVTVDSDGNVSVNDNSHNHTISNVDGLQNELDGKVSKTELNTRLQDNVQKNLLDCNGLTEQTINGITFTPIYDDNGWLLYINANGTATNGADYWFYSGKDTFDCEKTPVIISGCNGGSSLTYRFVHTPAWSAINNTEKKSSGTITGMYINIVKDYTANNLKFYPMIRKAEITDETYEPYYMSNKDITHKINNGTVNSAKKLENYYSSRPTTANITAIGDGSMFQFKATSNMKEGKPPKDGHILHFNWDNTGGYDSQIFVRNGTGEILARGKGGGVQAWNDWNKCLCINKYGQAVGQYMGSVYPMMYTFEVNAEESDWTAMAAGWVIEGIVTDYHSDLSKTGTVVNTYILSEIYPYNTWNFNATITMSNANDKKFVITTSTKQKYTCQVTVLFHCNQMHWQPT